MPPVASTTAREAMVTGLAVASPTLRNLQSGDRAILGQQRFGGITFDHPDRGRRAHGFDQRRHDRLARHVAADMHDAPRRMRGFAADREPAFEVAIERNAVTQQVMDAGAGFARYSERDRFIDQARADRDGIGGVRFRAVAFGDGGRDAALRPRRRGALAERCGGNHGDRTRRQLQRAEQPGKAAADDDDVVGVAGEIVEPGRTCLLSTPRRPCARARLRTSGDDSILSSSD